MVERALEAGYGVVAFARDASKLGVKHERLSVVEGDVLDGERVEAAVAEADVVLVVLGHARGSPENVQTEGTRRIVEAMWRHGVRRLVSLTGPGCGTRRTGPSSPTGR